MSLPEKLHTLTRAAADNGWNVLINHGVDTGGSPFVDVRLKTHGHDIHAGWHTRKTGTYRWDGAVVDNRQSDVTYTRVLDIVRSPEGATS